MTAVLGVHKEKKKATTLVLILVVNFYQLFWTQFSEPDERRGREEFQGTPL